MKLSLQKRILLFSLLVLTLTIAGNTWFSVDSFRRNYRDGILRRCETLAGGLARQIKVVLDLGLSLGEINGLSERCQTVVDNDPEIAYCLIEDDAGKLLFHNEGLFPEISQVKFLSNFSGQINLLDTRKLGKVYDLTVPLHDFDDDLVGRVRVGFRVAVLDHLALNHLYQALVVLGGAFIVMFLLIVYFARRDLVAPIQRLCGLAEEISSGNFTSQPPLMRTRELDVLGVALGGMARSLRDRDEEIRRNWQELEEANLELQSSYERLESISSELGRSREMYRSLLDDASDAILVCDEDDNIVMVNKSAETFFGLPRAQIEKMNYFSFLETIACADIDLQFERYQTVRPGTSVDTEIHFTRPADDKALVGWAVKSAIVGRDRKRFVQVVVRDATSEEEARNNLERAARELERLNQMKNIFLGLASHELKTPLTIIMGYLELLSTEFSEQLDPGAQDMVRQISKASERLAEIVRDMLDVSMLDSKTIDLVSQEVDANVLVRRAVEKAQHDLRQRNQTVRLETAEGLPAIRCDVDRMLQAVGNVLGNAIKFTPDEGQITLRTRLVRKSRLPEKFAMNGDAGQCRVSGERFPYVEISIADQGIGIAEEDQEAIFEKFYEIGDVEGHSSGKVAFKSRGAGLGLTIAKGVISIHGGAIWVESPGHNPETMPGSTFYILLPTLGSARQEELDVHE
jgi:PAS domain S-box-containing protein